jgi:hypothetical protein
MTWPTVIPAAGQYDRALEGELLLKRDWRDCTGRFRIGDYVSRDGTDVHQVIGMNGDGGDLIEVRCVVAPALYLGDAKPWAAVGDVDSNVPWRYEPVEYAPLTGPSSP